MDANGIFRSLLRPFLIVILVSSCFAVQYRGMAIRVVNGFGYSIPNDMNRFQNMLVSQNDILSIPIKVVDRFSRVHQTQFQIVKHFSPKFTGGIFWETSSTGGRVHYQDYSGELSYSQFASRNSMGLQVDYQLIQLGRISFNAFIQGATFLSRLLLENKLHVFDEFQMQELEYTSFGWGAEPGFFSQYKMDSFHIQIGLSYHHTFSNRLSKVDSRSVIKLEDGTEANLEWSSLRLSVALGYDIGIQ